MGRNWKKNRGLKRQAENLKKNNEAGTNNNSGNRNNNNNNNKDPYKTIEHGNYKLEAFYAYQGLHDYRWDHGGGDDQSGDSNSSTVPRLVPCTTDSERQVERQRWLSSIKTTLPAAFRIGQDVPDGLRMKLEQELQEYVGEKIEIDVEPRGGQQRIEQLKLQVETKLIEPVQKLPFIPHGYQLSVDKATIKRTPQLSKFHNWLTVQTEAGFITRQEAVSMIPPVVLDPKPHHMCLDLAAAPGSKTSQLLEVVNLPARPGDVEPTGCVVANDSDVKRAYMLVRQVKRINSPALFITSCDARFFPLLKDETKQSLGEDEGIFDRVLADVPCSGDGTSRKNPGIWKQFTPLNGYALHPLQLQIALKGAQSTKVGGYLCYSTCSMNPIENEAVVAELIRSSEGSLVLVDRSAEMPGLLARPGLSTWKNIAESKSNRQLKDEAKKHNHKMQNKRQQWKSKNQEHDEAATTDAVDATDDTSKDGDDTNAGNADGDGSAGDAIGDVAGGDIGEEDGTAAAPVSSADGVNETNGYRGIKTPFEPTTMDKGELKKLCEVAGMTEYDTYEDVPEMLKRRIRSTCFPPTPEEAATMNLHYCMRILPHDMDTGGFFVALLKKVAPLNPRAKKRFESLQQQDTVTTPKCGEEPEPTTKKPRIYSPSARGEKSDEDVTLEDANEKDGYPSNNQDADQGSKGGRKTKKSNQKGDMDDFLPAPNDIMSPLKDYYGLDDESFNAGQYMIRAKGDAKVLYFMTKTVKTKLIDRGLQDKVTTITSGVKGFTRNSRDSEVTYRVSQEGVHFIAPHMSKRKFAVDLDDFQKCLSDPTVQIADFQSESFRDQIRSLSVGCFVVQLKGYENDYIEKFVICMWRCRSDTVNYLVSAAEIDGLQSKIRSLRLSPLESSN
jgi:16S rRNA C967 or C1407 C5-methylase (RsmB/RsmF family)